MAYYKQVITYSFSDDDTRDSFMELLNSLGFKEMPDQSTWALPFSSKHTTTDVENDIINWSKGRDVFFEDDDFVQLFSAVAVTVAVSNHRAGIGTKTMVYDASTDSLK